MAEKIGQKNPRSLPKNPPDPRTAAKEAVLGEGLGITANSPSELANALSIGLLAVKDIAIQQGDRFAIE